MLTNKEYILYKISAGLSVVTVCMAFSTYVTRQSSQQIIKEISRIESTIHSKKRTLTMLSSEWYHLNNPYNLHRINKKSLKLHSLHPKQTTHIS